MSDFEYDYQRFEQIIKLLLESAWIRHDEELEIGEDVSDQKEVKIIFDGYGDLEDEDENDEYPEMDPIKIVSGYVEIRKALSGFSYRDVLNEIKDTKKLKLLYHSSNNGYEKLNLVRILINDTDTINSVIKKFINETYHVENEFICQLDPAKFDVIPEYIIAECDKIISELSS